MNQDTNRLLMEVEHQMRAINRDVINPEIAELTISDLKPVLCLVANARARYLKALFELGDNKQDNEDARPSEPQFEDLARLRYEYEELVNGAMALETAIQRGYLDVVSNMS